MTKMVSRMTRTVSDLALTRAISFYNIYPQIWALIELERPKIHCGNITFVYHDDFSKYMKVE